MTKNSSSSAVSPHAGTTAGKRPGRPTATAPSGKDTTQLLDRMAQLSWIYDLYRLGQNVESLRKAPEIYQQLLKHIARGFDAQGGCLALFRSDRSQLTIVAGIGIAERAIGKTVELGENILGKVAQEGLPILLNGPLPDAIFGRSDWDVQRPESAICWPLFIEDNLIGVISVSRFTGSQAFSEHHVEQGTALLNLVSLALGGIQLHIDQQERIRELKETCDLLETTQAQLLQSEKMASIGQLAAGVAHEINNPISFVNSNLGALQRYFRDMARILQAYEAALPDDRPELAAVRQLKQQIDLPFLLEDGPSLVAESKEGIGRVRKIVMDLREFSYADNSTEWTLANLHDGLESTLNILANELRFKAAVVREYGPPCLVECLPSQINQVFMNLLVNAAQAIEETGTITIRTGHTATETWVEIADTGMGMPPDIIKRIFEPFYTTKPVGKGTGLGLYLSYGIIQKHGGSIEVDSKPGVGTLFRIRLPLQRMDGQ